MEDYRVAFSVQAGGHSAIGAMHNAPTERRTLRLEVGNERVEILDLESYCPARRGARFIRDEIGKRETAAARKVVLDPPLVAPVSIQSDLEPKGLLVELARS